MVTSPVSLLTLICCPSNPNSLPVDILNSPARNCMPLFITCSSSTAFDSPVSAGDGVCSTDGSLALMPLFVGQDMVAVNIFCPANAVICLVSLLSALIQHPFYHALTGIFFMVNFSLDVKQAQLLFILQQAGIRIAVPSGALTVRLRNQIDLILVFSLIINQ